MSATIINLADRRATKLKARAKASPPGVFRNSNWPMDDFRTLNKHLSTLAVMIGGGSLADPLAIVELLVRYSVNASEAAKNADALLSRASQAERRVRRLERAGKRAKRP